MNGSSYCKSNIVKCNYTALTLTQTPVNKVFDNEVDVFHVVVR